MIGSKVAEKLSCESQLRLFCLMGKCYYETPSEGGEETEAEVAEGPMELIEEIEVEEIEIEDEIEEIFNTDQENNRGETGQKQVVVPEAGVQQPQPWEDFLAEHM